MRVLVTGAAGFIGSHLGRALHDRGHDVKVADKRWGTSTADKVWLHSTDLTDVKVIAHLGAQASTARSIADPVVDFEENALGTLHVLEAARRAGGIPVIYVSTVKVNPGHDGAVAPLGLSKQVGEWYVDQYADHYGVPSIILRPSTVYGPGQQPSPECGWVTWFAHASLAGKQVEIAGDGSQSRDVLYIDDMTGLLVDMVENFDTYLDAFEESPEVAFAVGGGPDNEVSLHELLAALDHKLVAHVPRLSGDLQRVVSDITLVSEVRGWKPTVNWRDGLGRTLSWLAGQP